MGREAVITAKKKLKRKEKKNIEKMLQKIRKEQRNIIKEEKRLHRIEEKILEEERKIRSIEHRLLEEEHEILAAVGRLRLKNQHILDFFKIIGGSLIGASFGTWFISQTNLVIAMPWENVIGILFLLLIIGGALIYKAENKTLIKKKYPTAYLISRLVYIWLISVSVGGLSVFLFLTEPLEAALLLKTILVGSYPALAGAVGFNFI